MIRRPPRSTQSRSSAASDVYKRQVFGVLQHLSNSDRHLAQQQQRVHRLLTQTFRRASTVPSHQSQASFGSDQQSFRRHSDKILELHVLQPSGEVKVIRNKMKPTLETTMMCYDVDRQQMMEEVVAIRRAVAVTTTTSGATTEREAEDVTTRMKTGRDVVMKNDNRSGRRPLLLVQLRATVVVDADARLHADDDKMTACPRNGTLLIANIDSELKSTSTTAQLVSKYCLLYTSPSPRDGLLSRMPSSA